MYDLSGIQDRLTIAVLNGIWKDQRYASVGNTEYHGVNITHNADLDETTWEIWRTTKDENGNKIREEGPFQGSWNNRENLGWDGTVVATSKKLDNHGMYYGLTSSLEEITILLNKIEHHLSILTETDLTNEEF